MSYDINWNYVPSESIRNGAKMTRWWINYPTLPINNPTYDVIDYLAYIQKLEHEIAELRRTVEDMQQLRHVNPDAPRPDSWGD